MTRVAEDDAFGGGMIALVPSEADRQRLALADGEDPDELHLTLTYLGPDAEQLTEPTRVALEEAARGAAAGTAPIDARVFGHATFNPDGFADQEPCAVYLIGDTTALDGLRAIFNPYAAAEQHAPYVPHVTAGYGKQAGDLSYTGPITFDAVRLALGADNTVIPLTGSTQEKGLSVSDVETKREFSQQERERLAKAGQALPDGSYPIETTADLDNAIS